VSYELEYFPPVGSKFKWTPKALNYSPWACDLSHQIDSNLWPLLVSATVDLLEGRYKWRVDIIDWHHRRSHREGECDSALAAILVAESTAESEFQRLMPDWVKTALANGWRPAGPKTRMI